LGIERFLYKVSATFCLGVAIGCFFAMISGYFSVWFIPVFLLGSILAGFVFLSLGGKFLDGGKQVWRLNDKRGNKLKTVIYSIFPLLLLTGGFLLPYKITGNLDGLYSTVRHLPKTLIGQNIGNFELPEFERAYNRAAKFIGERKVETLIFYKSFTHISAEAPGKNGKLRMTDIKGNNASSFGSVYDPSDANTLFTMQEASLPMFKKVIADVARKYKLRKVMYVGISRDIRWGRSYPDGSPDHSRHLDIRIVFNGGDHTLKYDAKTGVCIEDRRY